MLGDPGSGSKAWEALDREIDLGPDRTTPQPLTHVGDSGGQIDPCGCTQSKHGLHPLQCTYQAPERIRIKIRMYFDSAAA